VLRIDVAPQRRVTQARTCKAFPVEHLAPKLTCPTQVEDYDQLSSPLNCTGSFGSGVSSAARRAMPNIEEEALHQPSSALNLHERAKRKLHPDHLARRVLNAARIRNAGEEVTRRQ